MTIIRSYDELPSETKRQSMIVLKESEYKDLMKNYDDSKFLLDESICYLIEPSSDDIANSPILQVMDNKNQLVSGTVLVQDCENPSLYLPYDEGIKKSIIAKMGMFAHLCQLLGAKQIEFSVTEMQTTSSKNNAGISGSVKGVFNGEVGVKTAYSNEIEKQFKQSSTFKGMDKPDIVSAEKLMQSYLFRDDVNIIGFYNQAKYSNNRLQKQKCHFTLAENTTKSLSVVANANFPLVKKKMLKVNFDRLQEITKTLQVEYTVIFT